MGSLRRIADGAAQPRDSASGNGHPCGGPARDPLLLRLRRIIDRIAPYGVESSTRLGRYRWVVERTLAWLSRYRRLTIRYELRLDLHQAFTTLAYTLICRGYLQRTL